MMKTGSRNWDSIEVKFLQSDTIWSDVLRASHGETSISLDDLKELLDHAIEVDVVPVVRCNRCIHGAQVLFNRDGKQYVCKRHRCIIEDGSMYYCASGERT